MELVDSRSLSSFSFHDSRKRLLTRSLFVTIDDDLVRVLTEATGEVAGAFKARGVPESTRIIDIIGLDQARNEWACATLNEFRSFLKLTRYTDPNVKRNPDPVIANAARELNKAIENLDLMPGLSAEQPKPSQAGSGLARLAPSYTISGAIFSDAAALVHGDRYFTVDFNPGNLTSFLYEDLRFNPDSGSFGGVVGKLLIRNFPRHYTYNSTCALFPFSSPSTTNGILQRLKLIDQYDTHRPTPEWIVVDKRSIAEASSLPNLLLLQALNQFTELFSTLSNKNNLLSSLSSTRSRRNRRFHSPRAKESVSKHSWSYGGEAMRINLVQQAIVPLIPTFISTTMLLKDSNFRNSVIRTTSVPKSVINFRLAEANGSSVSSSSLFSLFLRSSNLLFFSPPFSLSRRRRFTIYDLAQVIKRILLGEKSGQGVVMSNNARKLYDRVLGNSSRALDEISDTLLYSMITFVSSVTACAKSIDFYLRTENATRL
ncbi:hypothetical protein JCM5350_002583 [Sporobolomyces pararoseus]